jgi:hypothetical protein
MSSIYPLITAIWATGLVAYDAPASVTEFTSKTAWQSAAGVHTTITFLGWPHNTNITTQYSNLGITFTDGLDLVYFSSGFLNDGVGLNGAFDTIAVAFNQPMNSIAIDFPGALRIRLYANGNPTYESTYFAPGGLGNFGGLVSTEPFDAALIFGSTSVFIDDLHFGPPIPAPGALALIAMIVGALRGRRRA